MLVIMPTIILTLLGGCSGCPSDPFCVCRRTCSQLEQGGKDGCAKEARTVPDVAGNMICQIGDWSSNGDCAMGTDLWNCGPCPLSVNGDCNWMTVPCGQVQGEEYLGDEDHDTDGGWRDLWA